MKRVIIPFMLTIGGSAAAVLRRSSQCCFQLEASEAPDASGALSGPIYQLDDGQNRVGGSPTSAPVTYCIDQNAGTITDSNARGCIFTDTTTQFQCDTGASPSPGFSVSLAGDLVYSGNSVFYACPATDGGEYNIYTIPVTNQDECVPVILSTGGTCTSSITSAPEDSTSSSSTSDYSSLASSTSVSLASASSASSASSSTFSTPVSSTTVYLPPASGYPAPVSGYPSPASGYPQPEAGSSSYSATPSSGISTTITSSPPAPTSVYTSPASTTAAAPSASASVDCEAQEYSCRTAPDANQAFCSAQRAECDGFIPDGSAASTTVTSISAACPTDLSGAYQYPHLIVPVDSSQPDTSLGNSYEAFISEANSTIYNFDIPESYSGMTCQLEFLFPAQDALTTSSYAISGSSPIEFYVLEGPASSDTTQNSRPIEEAKLGTVSAVPGTSSVVFTHACTPGTYGIMASTSGDLELSYFQDTNAPAIGVYVAAC